MNFFARKSAKNIPKNHKICGKYEEEKTVKEGKMHNFFVCAYKSQDFAQSQNIFARSHNPKTVTFRNSESVPQMGGRDFGLFYTLQVPHVEFKRER